MVASKDSKTAAGNALSRDLARKQNKPAEWLEAMILDIMKKSAKAALDQALDELLGDWK